MKTIINRINSDDTIDVLFETDQLIIFNPDGYINCGDGKIYNCGHGIFDIETSTMRYAIHSKYENYDSKATME